ncbi:hypothetical protein L6164_012925 [Bauhinia variegata]|uniref:Uncharacterized protein n=1 Tax=Bauhinia variegata TaxID=167791 RepID=A0ACB9PD29_BAUVA|nr:hypothetical protein L6164_012925 [Bauhinia variegata]
MTRECHPLLKGGIRGETKHRHGFSAVEMGSLASICEVVLPSLPLETLNRTVEQPGKAMQTFWTTSASQYPVPHEVLNISDT